jgi:hypothetical protein
MKHDSKVISIQRASAFRLDPTLTGEEAVVLRLLLVETPDRQVCNPAPYALGYLPPHDARRAGKDPHGG